MPKTYFKVSINEISVEDLVIPGKPHEKVDPFVEFNFAGDYKKEKTKHYTNTRSVAYHASFNFIYNTKYDHHLHQKYLEIKVWDKNTVHANALIGKMAVDLRTLATGPVRHSLKLQEAGENTGRINFSLEMDQLCRNMTIDFFKISFIRPSCSVNITPEMDWYLEYFYSLQEFNRIRSPSIKPNNKNMLFFDSLTTIKLDTTYDDIQNENIVFALFLDPHRGDPVLVGRCSIPIKNYWSIRKELKYPRFQENFKGVNDQFLCVITGEMAFAHGPKFIQMSKGIHNDRGIENAQLVHKDFPIPDPQKVRIVSYDRIPILPSSNQNIPIAMVSQHSSQQSQPKMPIIMNQIPNQVAIQKMPIVHQQHNSNIPYFDNSTHQQNMMRQKMHIQPITFSKRKEIDADDIVPFPRGWSIGCDSNGNVYFQYHPTKKTSWVDPRFLPEGWEQALDNNGTVYWRNHEQHANTLFDPRAMPKDWEMTIGFQDKNGQPILIFKNDLTHPVPLLDLQIDPRGLPEHISLLMTADPNTVKGKVYYSDNKKHCTSWVDPRIIDKWNMEAIHISVINHMNKWLIEKLQEEAKKILTEESKEEEDEEDEDDDLDNDDIEDDFQEWLEDGLDFSSIIQKLEVRENAEIDTIKKKYSKLRDQLNEEKKQ